MDSDRPGKGSEPPAAKPLRFLVVGDIGGEASFHLGDEAMLQANLERLRMIFPGAELTVASRDPEWSARFYGVEAVPRLVLADALAGTEHPEKLVDRLVQEAWQYAEGRRDEPPAVVPEALVRALARADGLVISGGGNLNASWVDQLYERVFLLMLAERLDVAAAVTGQTLGPHIDAREREVLRFALRSPRLLVLRESYSLALARALGVPAERTMLHLDDAFFLPRFAASSGPGRPPSNKEGWIAVTVTRVAGGIEPLAAQLGQIARHTGRRLVFVPHAKEPDSDTELAHGLAERVSPEVDTAVISVPTAERGRWLAENAALVLSMRYHPLVFAVASGVPGLGIYVDEYTRVKLRGALGHGGMREWVVPFEMALGGGLFQAARDLWERRHAVRERLRSETERWEAMEARYRRRLESALRRSGGAPDQVEDADPPNKEWWRVAETGSHRPQGTWARLSKAYECRADEWFHERIGLVERVDRAVEYALSLEATLAERDREVSGLKQLLGERPSGVDASVDGAS